MPVIGMFDSGVGGLSVLRAVRAQLPLAEVIYFGDNGHIPYGPRPLAEVRRFSEAIADDADPMLDAVSLPMTREDIADFLGLQKETVSRSFGQLEERGFIKRLDSHRVQITNLAALRELAGVMDFAAPQRLVRG